MDEFLQIVIKTVESYFATCNEEEYQETSDVSQFILAICGTITNIAASSNGRDFLVSHEDWSNPHWHIPGCIGRIWYGEKHQAKEFASNGVV